MAENKEKKQSFFEGVKAEFKKINWPSRDELIRKTGLVVVISLIMGALISVIDSIALQVFRLLIG